MLAGGLAWPLAALAAVAAVGLWRGPLGPRLSLRRTPDGELEFLADEGKAGGAFVLWQSRCLVVLRAGARPVLMWPDSLSTTHFRLLSVHARWGRQTRASPGPDEQ